MRDHFECFNTIASNLHFPTMLLEHVTHYTAHTWAIIYNENVLSMWLPGSWLNCWYRRHSGSTAPPGYLSSPSSTSLQRRSNRALTTRHAACSHWHVPN